MSLVLGMQDAMRMRRIVICVLYTRISTIFSTISHNPHDFLKRLLNRQCVF